MEVVSLNVTTTIKKDPWGGRSQFSSADFPHHLNCSAFGSAKLMETSELANAWFEPIKKNWSLASQGESESVVVRQCATFKIEEETN